MKQIRSEEVSALFNEVKHHVLSLWREVCSMNLKFYLARRCFDSEEYEQGVKLGKEYI
jgi:hypothetical protein